MTTNDRNLGMTSLLDLVEEDSHSLFNKQEITGMVQKLPKSINCYFQIKTLFITMK